MAPWIPLSRARESGRRGFGRLWKFDKAADASVDKEGRRGLHLAIGIDQLKWPANCRLPHAKLLRDRRLPLLLLHRVLAREPPDDPPPYHAKKPHGCPTDGLQEEVSIRHAWMSLAAVF